MADAARAVLIAAIVLQAGVLLFVRCVHAPVLQAGAATAGAAALRRLLLAVAAVTAAAALVGLLAGPGEGHEHVGWLIATAAGVLAFALVTGTDADALAGTGARAVALAVAVAALLGVPALLGNATLSSAWLVVPANVLHVSAAAAWTGGIASLLVLAAVPLPPDARTRLLAAATSRFSTIALLAVLAIAFSGLLEGLVLVRRVDALVTTGYGRIVAIKALLLSGLAVLGALQRGRTLPDLQDAARGTGNDTAATALLRRVLRTEAALLATVLVLSGVLAATTPSRAAHGQAITRSVDAGTLTLGARLTPGSPGSNRLVMSVPAGVAGVQVSARQPKLAIGPIRAQAVRIGPRRFAVARLELGAPGTWEVTIVAADASGRASSGVFTARLR